VTVGRVPRQPDVADRVLDSMDLEREKGITILAKKRQSGTEASS
jgi:predicted membrane GTPase involved in stress response